MVENICKYLEMEVLGNIWKYLLVENEKVLVGHTHTLVFLAAHRELTFAAFSSSTSPLTL